MWEIACIMIFWQWKEKTPLTAWDLLRSWEITAENPTLADARGTTHEGIQEQHRENVMQSEGVLPLAWIPCRAWISVSVHTASNLILSLLSSATSLSTHRFLDLQRACHRSGHPLLHVTEICTWRGILRVYLLSFCDLVQEGDLWNRHRSGSDDLGLSLWLQWYSKAGGTLSKG